MFYKIPISFGSVLFAIVFIATSVVINIVFIFDAELDFGFGNFTNTAKNEKKMIITFLIVLILGMVSIFTAIDLNTIFCAENQDYKTVEVNTFDFYYDCSNLSRLEILYGKDLDFTTLTENNPNYFLVYKPELKTEEGEMYRCDLYKEETKLSYEDTTQPYYKETVKEFETFLFCCKKTSKEIVLPLRYE